MKYVKGEVNYNEVMYNCMVLAGITVGMFIVAVAAFMTVMVLWW